MANFLDLFQADIERVLRLLQSEFRSELEAQGHRNSGKLSDSIAYNIEQTATDIVGNMYFLEYGFVIDKGVTAGRVPFSAGSGARGSKYIDGLIGFFKSKGLGDKESRGAAFATARKHKTEGIPTRKSYEFSNNGRRKGFTSVVIENNQTQIYALFETAYEAAMKTIIENIVENTIQIL